jgi:hypothetical protein
MLGIYFTDRVGPYGCQKLGLSKKGKKFIQISIPMSRANLLRHYFVGRY